MNCCCNCLIRLIRRIIAETPQPTTLAGTQAQLQNSPNVLLNDGDMVVFDTIIMSNNPNITYAAGQFTINKTGTYSISWQVATDGTTEFTNINFTIQVNGVNYATASIPIVTGQISGTALIVANAGDEITLVNTSLDGVQLANTNVQANIVIMGLN